MKIADREQKEYIARINWESRFVAYVVLTFTISVLYYPSIDNFFIADDFNRFPCLKENVEKILSIFWSEGCDPLVHYRPVTYVFQTLTYNFFGTNYQLHHLAILVLHILCSIAVYEIALLLLSYHLYPSFYFALVSSLLFAVHPRHLEPATFIHASENQLCALSYFWGIFFFIIYCRLKHIKYLFLCGLFYLFSLLSKESGITLPLVCLAYYFVFYYSTTSFYRVFRDDLLGRVLVLFSAVLLLYFSMRYNAFGSLIGQGVSSSQLQYSLLSTVKGLIQHLAAMMVPNNLPGMHSIEASFRGQPGLIIAAAIIGGLIAFYFLRHVRSKIFLFGLAWMVIGVLLTLNFGIALSTPTSGRWLYISLGGFSIGLMSLLSEIQKKYKPEWIAVSLILVFSFFTYGNVQMGKESAYIAKNFLKGLNTEIDQVRGKKIIAIVPYLYKGIYTLNSLEDGVSMLYGERGERFLEENQIEVHLIAIDGMGENRLVVESRGGETLLWFSGEARFIGDTGYESAQDRYEDIVPISSKGAFLAKKYRIGDPVDLIIAPDLSPSNEGIIVQPL